MNQNKAVPMTRLQIQDFPESLKRELRSRAAREGITLKTLVIKIINSYIFHFKEKEKVVEQEKK